MKTYRFSLVVLLCLMAIRALAQECVVSGQIFDSETKETIPGVPVIVKGTTKGITTDVDGIFRIKTSIGALLIVKNVGYETIEIQVTDKLVAQSKIKPIAIQLKLNSKIIEDVAFMGYSKQKKLTATESMEVVGEKELKNAVGNNIDQALQGRAGLYVTTSGSPGASSHVVIRGIGTINSSDPLYVIDGVPQTTSPKINPLDIKTVTILKDASACSIYGSRGANGVVVITTKTGTIYEDKKPKEYTYRFRKDHVYKATYFVVDSIIVDSVFNFKRLGFKERQVDTFYLARQKNGLQFVCMSTKPTINQNLKTISSEVKQWVIAHPRCAIGINDTIQVSKSLALQAINARNIKSIRYMDQPEAEKRYGTLGEQGVLEFILE